MAQEENKEEKEEVKTQKPKVIIEYFEASKKSFFRAVVVDKKGVLTKTRTGENEDALEALKKFVNSL